MATTTTVLKARVERGAALLDAEQPGWAPRIDVPTLDMLNGYACVLGQLYGGYYTGCDALRLDDNDHRLGFNENMETRENDTSEFQRLLPLWREAIEARCGGSER